MQLTNPSKIIDVSWPISKEMTAYKDRQITNIVPTKTFTQDGARESLLTLGSHTGTHIDAPAHFVKDGSTVDQIELQSLIGHCQVIDCTQCHQQITAIDLMACDIKKDDIILLKTTNSRLDANAPFNQQFVYVATDAAQLLAEKQVRTVGIDYLGIERNQPGHQTHLTLLTQVIIIIEGLRLQNVEAGTYNLCCLPLHIVNGDAAPARAVIWR